MYSLLPILFIAAALARHWQAPMAGAAQNRAERGRVLFHERSARMPTRVTFITIVLENIVMFGVDFRLEA